MSPAALLIITEICTMKYVYRCVCMWPCLSCLLIRESDVDVVLCFLLTDYIPDCQTSKVYTVLITQSIILAVALCLSFHLVTAVI